MQDTNLNEMLLVRRQKLKGLIENGKDPHEIEKFEDTIYSKTIKENYSDYEGKVVRLAGRIMTKRGHGKVCFMDLQDFSGRIQLFNKLDMLKETYEDVKALDLGDIVGVEGEVFTTHAGEISVRTSKVVLLTKSLQLLPDKFHGLKDVDLRYRQRYVDLIVNPEIKDVFIMRSKIISAIRKYLDNLGFLEVETPILNTIAGGANARPFITHHNTLDIDMYLRIANELYLKRLIVGGFDKVYEMGRMFRNEGMDKLHNPEYTAIELYQAYVDYEEMMRLCEEMIYSVCMEVVGTAQIEVQGKVIDFKPPWRRISMVDAVKEYVGIDFETILTDEDARKLATEKNIEITPKTTRGEIISLFFEEFCEQHMVQPTFVTKHPVEISPLAKRDPKDKRYTQRFEAFVNCGEIANAFSELNDAIDQKERFLKQVEARENGDDEAQMMDYDFINALEIGLAPTGGMGIGIDRLIMYLTNQESIRDVLLFPTMKPINEKEEQ